MSISLPNYTKNTLMILFFFIVVWAFRVTIEYFLFIKELNNVDLPVLGSPNIPTLSVLILPCDNYIFFNKFFYKFLCCFFLCYLKTISIT